MAVANGAGADMQCSTINLRVLGALVPFASKDETRYYLQGVCVEIDERGTTYAATDGKTFVAYREDLDPDAKDNRLLGVFIIPAPQCKEFKLGKDDDGRAKMFGSARLTLAYNFVDVTFAPIDGVFPDWRKMLPQGRPSGEIGQFNPAFLTELAKFSKALDLGLPIIAHNGERPTRIWFPIHPHVLAVLMPFKAQHVSGMPSLPHWAIVGPEREQGDIEDAPAALSPEPHCDVADAPFQLPADA
jgi:DNA polymerase-3 subunit beta